LGVVVALWPTMMKERMAFKTNRKYKHLSDSNESIF
jgi:hypothetical protein